MSIRTSNSAIVFEGQGRVLISAIQQLPPRDLPVRYHLEFRRRYIDTSTHGNPSRQPAGWHTCFQISLTGSGPLVPIAEAETWLELEDRRRIRANLPIFMEHLKEYNCTLGEHGALTELNDV
jgi:hypothetical protein